MTETLYHGEILSRKLVGKLKCYSVQSDNPKFQFTYSDLESKICQTILLWQGKTNDIGFAIVWRPDVIIGKIDKTLRGFDIRDYEFPPLLKPKTATLADYIQLRQDIADHKIPDLKEVPFNNICQMNAEIIGGESRILRNSKTKEEYLSKWFTQTHFKQKYRFIL